MIKEIAKEIENNDNYEMLDGGEKIRVIQELLQNILEEVPMESIEEEDIQYIGNVKKAIRLLYY